MASNLPAILGGSPVRTPGSYRTTPEVDEREVDYVGAWLAARNFNPGGAGGLAVADGLTLSASVREALGDEQAALAAEFAAVHAPGHRLEVVPCSNGTHAIRLVLTGLTQQALPLGLRGPRVGDEVIVPALTWKGSVTPILARNLVPVLVDIDPGTLTVDPAAVEAAITDRTCAILGVDLFSRMFDRDPLVALAKRHSLALIEDCAQSVGAVYRGRPAGAIGHCGTVSMQGSKVFSGGGEGGLVMTAPGSLADGAIEALVDQVVSASTCGRPVGDSRELIADNDRMPGIVAACARAQLARFGEQNTTRLQTFPRLDAVAGELLGIEPLAPQPKVDRQPTYKWPFRVDLRRWKGMNLDQVKVSLMAELGAHVDRVYAPLAGDPTRAAGLPNSYDPHSDASRRISGEYWQRIDRRRYNAPEAWAAFESVLAIEHAAGLDPEIPTAFAEAVTNLQSHAERLAREVRTS